MKRVFALMFLSMSLAHAAVGALQKDPGPIPPLRPPKGKIALDLPESTIFRSALALSFLILIAGRMVQMRKPRIVPPPLPPIVRARNELASIAEGDIGNASRIVREYVLESFRFADAGATADEIASRFAVHPLASAESAETLHAFLTEADRARFAPGFAQTFAPNCVERAKDLIERIEAARIAATPPPLPQA